ncbi:hypothetical protein [Micromonospora sp. RP3T]|uniref:hypothetical protein n=1 Tax=Micromonospora sp. RP3T TaxID=2135446 RepID=UPI001E39F3A8|nr:hypothetical protein [Micromonospora sp. RP3T]
MSGDRTPTAVVFDADETLVDLRPAVIGALPRPAGLEPDAEVSTLAELPGVLAALTSANA